MTPQICSFFDEQGFVIDDWHELEVTFLPRAGEYISLCQASQSYATQYKVVRIEHTVHRDLDHRDTQILDIIVAAIDFGIADNDPSSQPANSIRLVDDAGRVLENLDTLHLRFCPRVNEVLSHAADGSRGIYKHEIERVNHTLIRSSDALIQQIVLQVKACAPH